MKVYRLITICGSVVAAMAANGCFAQSATSRQDSVASGAAQELSGVAVQNVDTSTAVVLGKTRAQVMREQADFQNSDQAVQMRELYRGN
ncbi:MAG: hypothetical protein JWR14_5465 [Caballeronia sp.]|jgi:6,7-dimethyl-8-ribityllumazine synthase|uniref:hypothetical protein n=1 Tax=Caballeronia sp. TaxID=1931223 RepID=UPI00260DBDB3|nr:hypothetical protein [Caballeronia sp.]MDB5835635.1 hypothetical protein [Caballeronia sp.]